MRALQSHGRSLERVGPGHRVAVNLVGVRHAEVGRGDAVVHAGRWHATSRVDASLAVLAGLDHEVSSRGAHVLHVGTAKAPVRVRILGPSALAPGDAGLVRLHLPVALPLQPGDRFVLRESGRDETVGGGEVLDVAPVVPASKARPTRSGVRVVAERGWVDADLLERLTGERRAPTVGRWVVSEEALASARAAMAEAVETAGPLGLDAATLDQRQRALLPGLDGVVVEGGRVRRQEAADPLAGHPYVTALEASPFTPPDPVGVDRAELSELVRRGMVVERDGCYFAPAAVDLAARRLAALLADHPEGFTVAQARDALGTTRKHALPLLAVLDASGVTRRRGDVRVGGPRLPPP